MPELPEVEVVTRQLKKILQREPRLLLVRAHRKDLRFPLPIKTFQILKDQRLLSLERRGKYILWHFDSTVLVSHLGMTGSWREVHPTEPLKAHDHVIFEFEKVCLAYNDPRRFGFIVTEEKNTLDTNKFLKNVGLDPFHGDWTEQSFLVQARERKTSIKNFLMDQRIMSGIGNIYASEALFLAGIHPERLTSKLSPKNGQDLLHSIREVLSAAIEAGGSTISDYRNAKGETGGFQNRFKVYGREGESCFVCGSKIRQIVQSGRSSFFCAKCQRR